jgi:hypothetical protein
MNGTSHPNSHNMVFVLQFFFVIQMFWFLMFWAWILVLLQVREFFESSKVI